MFQLQYFKHPYNQKLVFDLYKVQIAQLSSFIDVAYCASLDFATLVYEDRLIYSKSLLNQLYIRVIFFSYDISSLIVPRTC